MLDSALAGQLRTYLTKVVDPVSLVSSLDDSDTSAKTAELLDEIAELSGGRVTHTREGQATRRPSFQVTRTGNPDVAVEFAGMPMGHEFTSLVLALLQVGGHPSTAAADLLDQIRGLDGTAHFETFFSQSCQNCPDVVQALNLIAVLNPGITHTAIDGATFPDEVEARGVLAVPMVFRDGAPFGQGRMTLEEIVRTLDDGSADRDTDRLNGLDPFDVLVVGGGPAGATSAIYLARKGIRTGVVAQRFGGQLLDTLAIENYPSVEHTEGPRMAADLERQVSSYAVELIAGHTAASLTPASQPGGLHTLTLDNGATLQARAIIAAPGARWRTMDVPGESEYRTKGVTFCPHCDGPLFKDKPVAVIGGGNSGVEAAIDLAGICERVTLVEFVDELRADEVLQRSLRALPNVEVRTGRMTTEVLGDGRRVVGLAHAGRDGEPTEILDVAGVFVQIGLLPNTEWLEGAIELTERGEIVIDARGATSVPGIFAAGDATTGAYKQIATATGSGATAALTAFDHLIRSSSPVA